MSTPARDIRSTVLPVALCVVLLLPSTRVLADGMEGKCNGVLSTSVNLEMPPYYGLAPKLSLAYNSGSADGFLGMGWVLTGQSYIERAAPGSGAPAYRSTDVFLLDGEELVPCTVLGGTHCTKHQNYLRIKQDAASNQWFVWDKQGAKSTYTALYTTSFGTFRWALKTEQDTNGNVATYDYWVDPGQNAYLDTIRYNGVSIKLWREARTDDISFANGVTVGHTQYRLKTIDVTVGGIRARAYKLEYSYGPNTGRSRLAKVTRYGEDARLDAAGTVTGGTALPAQTFTYGSGGGGYGSVNWNSSVGSWDSDSQYLFGDVNGDGKTDEITIYRGTSDGQAYASVLHSNGVGFTFVAFNKAIGGWDGSIKNFLADVNGDGKSDLIRIYKTRDGGANAQVNPSDGAGYPGQSFNSGIGDWNADIKDYFTDVNGDGKADLVRIYHHSSGNAFAQVNPSNGSGYPSQSFNSNIGGWNPDIKDYFADINGDGKADLIRIYQHTTGHAYAQVNLSNGAGFPSESANGDVGGWNSSLNDYLADVNGDGKSDLIRIYQNGANSFAQINLSNGHGFDGASWNSSLGGWDPAVIQDYFVDVNGDKRADSVRIYKQGTEAHAQVRLFDGVGYATDNFNGVIGGWDPTRIRDGFADVDGDGKADLVRVYQQGTDFFDANAQINLSTGGEDPPDLLTSYTNGLGSKVSISYSPSSDWVNSYLPLATIIPTVASVRTEDGRGVSSTKTYFYFGGLWSNQTREFLGFRYERAVLDVQGTTRETYYSQSVSNSGAAVDSYLKNSFGRIYNYVHNNYTENNTNAPYTALLASAQTYVYDLTDWANELRTEYAYDVYGNITQTIDWGYYLEFFDERTKTNTYAYNTDAYIVGLKSSSSTNAGVPPLLPQNKTAELRFCYDRATFSAMPVRGNLTRTEIWSNKTNSYVAGSVLDYDSFGNVVGSTDARGQTTATTYDPTYHQFATQVTNALGQTILTTWDVTLGVPTTVIDVKGGLTVTGYDVLGRKRSSTDAANNRTQWDYLDTGNPNLQRLRATRPDGSADGLWSEAYYDGLSRTYRAIKEGADAAILGPSGGLAPFMQDTVYVDATSRPQKTSLWYATGGSPTWRSYTYDGMGRLTRTTLPDGNFSTITYQNDFWGKSNIITKDELGHQKSASYDGYDQLQQLYETNGSAQYLTSYQYDGAGRLVQMTDARSNLTTYAYDSLGHKISMTDPDMGVLTYTYDNGGLLLSQRDAKNQVVRFTYDALGRRTTKLVNEQPHTTWFYDEPGHGDSVGELTRVVYPSGSESHSWDKLGQETSTTQTIGTVSKTLTRTYDALGRPRTLTYPDGDVVTYTYNAAGNLFTVISSTGVSYVSGMSWDPAGRLTAMSYGNGTTISYVYDPNRAWLSTASVKKSGTALYDASYDYYPTGLVRTMTQDTKPTAKTLNFTYDDLGRSLTVGGAQSQSFTYDEVGSMTSNSLLGNYSYGDTKHKHAVTAAGTGLVYSYDDNGNRTSGDGKTYGWDAEDQLVSVTKAGVTTSFAYSISGNRLKKTQGTNTTLYFGTTVEQVNGNDVQYYYAGPMLVAKRELQTNAKTWYHADRLGSTRLMTNEQGAEVKEYDYRPFGQLQVTSGTASNERGFTGHVTDSEDDLIYMRARHYDPKLGSFISPDTVISDPGNPQDYNAYSYCLNNPVNNTDPTGHAPLGGWAPPAPAAPLGGWQPPSSSDQGNFAADASQDRRHHSSASFNADANRNSDVAKARAVEMSNHFAFVSTGPGARLRFIIHNPFDPSVSPWEIVMVLSLSRGWSHRLHSSTWTAYDSGAFGPDGIFRFLAGVLEFNASFTGDDGKWRPGLDGALISGIFTEQLAFQGLFSGGDSLDFSLKGPAAEGSIGFKDKGLTAEAGVSLLTGEGSWTPNGGRVGSFGVSGGLQMKFGAKGGNGRFTVDAGPLSFTYGWPGTEPGAEWECGSLCSTGGGER